MNVAALLMGVLATANVIIVGRILSDDAVTVGVARRHGWVLFLVVVRRRRPPIRGRRRRRVTWGRRRVVAVCGHHSRSGH